MPTRGNVVAVRAGVVGLVAIAFVVAACGGGSRLSKSAFDAKANAICKKYRAKVATVPTPKSINDVPAYVVEVKPSIERALDEVANLKPPQNLQSTYDRWVSTERAALKDVDRLRRAAERNDLAGVNRTIKALDDKNTHSNKLAAQLGADVCAKD
jgi:hypothetical protein